MTPEYDAALERRDVLDLLNNAHAGLVDDSPMFAAQCKSFAYSQAPAVYADIVRGWSVGTAPRPGSAEWPAWYLTERADVAELITELEANERV